MKKQLAFFLAILTYALSARAASNEESLKTALKNFQKGEYATALTQLKKAPQSQDAKIEYWSGQCEFKLQKFDNAIKSFKTAIQYDTKSEFRDAHYFLGQSYYAVQDYKQAKLEFEESTKVGYKTGASMYYTGYIENILGDDKKALITLSQIQALPDSEEEMKQAAYFQTGEIHYEHAKKISDKEKSARDEIYREKTIPAYKSAVKIDDDSALGKQANGRLMEIRAKLTSEAPKTAAGLPIPRQLWVLRATQDVKYDTNITNEADGKVIKVSYSGSFLEKTGLFGKYEFNVSEWLIITPELDANATFHSRRKNGGVFSNDSTAISPAVRSRLDHIFLNKPASGLCEVEMAYNTRDFKSNHNQLYYNKSINYILGERAVLFPWAFMSNTTFKLNYKFMLQQNPLQNYRALGLSLIQAWAPYPGHSLTSTVSYESQTAKDGFYDQRSYKTGLSYMIPNLYWNSGLAVGLNMTFTDTMKQFANRGNEVTTNPTLTATKTLSDHWAVNLNYAFTRNSSRDNANYTYSKHVIGLGVTATL